MQNYLWYGDDKKFGGVGVDGDDLGEYEGNGILFIEIYWKNEE